MIASSLTVKSEEFSFSLSLPPHLPPPHRYFSSRSHLCYSTDKLFENLKIHAFGRVPPTAIINTRHSNNSHAYLSFYN